MENSNDIIIQEHQKIIKQDHTIKIIPSDFEDHYLIIIESKTMQSEIIISRVDKQALKHYVEFS